MRWKERTTWALVFAASLCVNLGLWAVHKTESNVWGNEQYLNYLDRVDLQEQLQENQCGTAASDNREWLLDWAKTFERQKQSASLKMSEDQYGQVVRAADRFEQPIGND